MTVEDSEPKAPDKSSLGQHPLNDPGDTNQPVSRDNSSFKKEEQPPLALAVQWVARMSSIVTEMVLPALVGHYFDGKLGTTYFSFLGLVLGVSVGMWHLFQVAREFK